MIQETLVKILLSPFTALYAVGISIRNLLYKNDVLKSARFDIPVVSVGNLSIGGTGKTPHIEYLVNWLKQYIPVAILSRGYKRETTGFLMSYQAKTVKDIGDEPFQYTTKFPDVPVAVSENRELGIPLLLKSAPDTKMILLDDAFQHLSVKPYINILLTSYDRPFYSDHLLPSGRLREWRSSYERADIILVTKCPAKLTKEEGADLKLKINPLPHQRVFFTEYRYSFLYHIFDGGNFKSWNKNAYVLLVTGIANTQYLEEYVKSKVKHVQRFSFADHHWYTNFDVGQIKRQYDALPGPDKYIVTTEKDATRLSLHRDYILENNLPIFALPIEVNFLWNQEEEFKQTIADKLIAFKA